MTSTTRSLGHVVFVAPPFLLLREPESQGVGRRGSSFGDLIFVDHEEIKFGTNAYLALVVIDGATNLLWATALTSLEAPETLNAFRQWTEENNCVPRGIVGDQAFFTDQFMSY